MSSIRYIARTGPGMGAVSHGGRWLPAFAHDVGHFGPELRFFDTINGSEGPHPVDPICIRLAPEAALGVARAREAETTWREVRAAFQAADPTGRPLL